MCLPPPGLHDQEHEEVLHYVGGFVMCSQLRQCHTLKNCAVYQLRFKVIRDRMLEGMGAQECPLQLKMFTKEKSRGGFKVLGWDAVGCHDFFKGS